jgi:tripartite-type tricarboxylate transporter receptor subunit TctC
MVFCFVLNFHPLSAAADAVADFYRGKQLQIIVRSAPGGSYDIYSRLVASHMMKHIPGNPTFITRHMTGAAGIQAVNFVENVAPKDFPNDLARVIHNADARLLDRNVQSSKMVHAALLLLMEAVTTDLVSPSA